MQQEASTLRRTPLTQQDRALVRLGSHLLNRGYRFTTTTPATHALVNRRDSSAQARTLSDIFGWNRPFSEGVLDHEIEDCMRVGRILQEDEQGGLRSALRFSTVDDGVIMHSGFPTTAKDSVFFGPDTYRFIRVLRQVLPGGARLLELGAGSGAAALALSSRYEELLMTDINPQAVRLSRLNSLVAGVDQAESRLSDLYTQVAGQYDAIIANPPYMIDGTDRWYRNGGGGHGVELAVRMAQGAFDHLSPGGTLVLYTGTPIIRGDDQFLEAMSPYLELRGIEYEYEEIEVDVFGEELAAAAYHEVDRIAIVALIARCPGSVS